MAKEILEDIELFPIQEKMLEELLKPYENVTTALGTPLESLTAQQILEVGTLLNQQLTEVQPITEELEQQGYSMSDIMSAGVFYAPYIPLYQTPTLNISDLTNYHPIMPGATFNKGLEKEIFVVKKYDDIYSDINNRFELMDL